MRIVVPMSGVGARFQRAGYRTIKPLIEVHGRPMIEWVVSMFPGEHEFLFVCRQDHLHDGKVRSTLERIAPGCEIVGIEGHKLGPVHAVLQVVDRLAPSSPVVVNYADFYMRWDFADFERRALAEGWDGAIPCYHGFHPHLLLESNVYAGCRIDGDKWLQEIREKFSFESDKTQGWHSAGTYYFASGDLVARYFEQQRKTGEALEGEHYVSLVYRGMLEDGLRVKVYDDIPHFCQWGTPRDLADYLFWAKLIGQFER
jgi:NDP-sugar pyrophosphorylase family protein